MGYRPRQPLLMVVMDGVGISDSEFGNAFALADKPNLDALKEKSLYRTLFAHGTYVGLPSDEDIGNSEVGHNALGAGRIFDQGAKLVQKAIADGSLFEGTTWGNLCESIKVNHGTLHLIGLLSDGNVHSHQDHLHALVTGAVRAGVARVRIHALLDGRDVGERTAHEYAKRLEEFIATFDLSLCDIKVASGGGRMRVTMDRYGADWEIVERGWKAHVLGEAPFHFDSLSNAIAKLREETGLTDQYFPPFVIVDKNSQPVGRIEDGDGVVFFNFRGDRAIEISQAFCDDNFSHFDRQRIPKVFYAGMMEYDGDLHIPQNYLVSPPLIEDTVGEYLANLGIRQFACSETQKFGHVTYFWNGNRSGKFSEELEEYIEVPSDKIDFDKRPAMKSKEIADEVIMRIKAHSFDFGRINFANGDMVGHTGNLKAALAAVTAVDEAVGRIALACEQEGFALLVTADHGNCDEMFEGRAEDYPGWKTGSGERPKAKTSHTRNPVPLYLFNVGSGFHLKENLPKAGLANMANTFLSILGLPIRDLYLPSVVERAL